MSTHTRHLRRDQEELVGMGQHQNLTCEPNVALCLKEGCSRYLLCGQEEIFWPGFTTRIFALSCVQPTRASKTSVKSSSVWFFLFCGMLDTGPRRPLRLELSDRKVHLWRLIAHSRTTPVKYVNPQLWGYNPVQDDRSDFTQAGDTTPCRMTGVSFHSLGIQPRVG